jgi:hypothetical protein
LLTWEGMEAFKSINLKKEHSCNETN